jgi:hypothetical protein
MALLLLGITQNFACTIAYGKSLIRSCAPASVLCRRAMAEKVEICRRRQNSPRTASLFTDENMPPATDFWAFERALSSKSV